MILMHFQTSDACVTYGKDKGVGYFGTLFHAGDRGSNPLGDAKIKQGLRSNTESLFLFTE
jgi:hypothetical protein